MITTPAVVPWFLGALVGMEVGPTGAQSGCDPADVGYAARFNGCDVVRRCVEAQSDYLVIWARDGEWAYYDSTCMPKCPGLGRRDVLREAVDEARSERLPVIAYCVVQQSGSFLRDHPELAMRDRNGKVIDRYCYNSGYLGVMKEIVAELLAYDIDGLHMDMLDQGMGPPYGCWCATCRDQFEAQTGRPMPDGVTWDNDWDEMLEFRYRSSELFERAIYETAKASSPGASVSFNYHGVPPFSWEVGQRPVQHARTGDFVTGETGVWAFSALGVGLNAEFYRAATPGVRYQTAMQRSVRNYHDQTTRPLADIRWEMLTLLAHGCFVTMIDKTAYDGWLDPVTYQRTGEAFTEAHGKRDTFVGKPLQDVAVYYSSRTRDWYGREDAGRSSRGFLGAHKALVLEHIPWGVALDEDTSLDSLSGFAVLILPNAGILSKRELATFEEYVEGGGKLIVTGWTGVLDRYGEPGERSALEHLIGGRLVRRLETYDNHVRLPAESGLCEGIEPAWPFLVEGPAVVYEAAGAATFGELLRPHRTIRQLRGEESTDRPLSAFEPVGPAVLLNSVGAGQVLTFAGSPDEATASEYHISEDRKLLANAVRLLHPQPRVVVNAPPSVESIVIDDPVARVLRVHLISYVPTPETTSRRNWPYGLPGQVEEAAMFRARVELFKEPKRVRVGNSRSELRVAGRETVVVVDDIHEVLTFDY